MAREPRYESSHLQDLVAAADESVKAALSTGKSISAFLASIDRLEAREMEMIVDQAIILLEDFYVHLPHKKAMHAVDPLQRLKLLRRKINQIASELEFHHLMTDIFVSTRDLHTNYILPSYFSGLVAFLPFIVRASTETGERNYIVARVADGFRHDTFKAGVEIKHWNGIPIERAVEIAASHHAGSNPEARRARGIAGLTKRAIDIAPPPDEEWVTIGYNSLDGRPLETKIDWTISELPEEIRVLASEMSIEAASAYGLDLEGDTFQRINKMLFAQDVVAAKRNINSAQAAVAASGGTLVRAAAIKGMESTMPDVFSAKDIEVGGRKYGYIRISTFSVKEDEPFVNEFIRLIELPEMPHNGLIIDVRGNGGGLIWAGERLLQLLTPKTVEPSRFQFIYTPATLKLSENAPEYEIWMASLLRAFETGATFSTAFPITPPERCNDIGQRYYGPVVLLTDALCYSTTDIFAAGFRDHDVGKILGVDGNTGAGGANVWTLDIINQIFRGAGLPEPLKDLPKGVNLRVAVRRTLRVGPEAGTVLEDLGVPPDEIHELTRNDILTDNADLIAHAVRLLASQRVHRFSVEQSRANGANSKLQIKISTNEVDYVDLYINGRPIKSLDTTKNNIKFICDANSGDKINLHGFLGKSLVCSHLAKAI